MSEDTMVTHVSMRMINSASSLPMTGMVQDGMVGVYVPPARPTLRKVKEHIPQSYLDKWEYIPLGDRMQLDYKYKLPLWAVPHMSLEGSFYETPEGVKQGMIKDMSTSSRCMGARPNVVSRVVPMPSKTSPTAEEKSQLPTTVYIGHVALDVKDEVLKIATEVGIVVSHQGPKRSKSAKTTVYWDFVKQVWLPEDSSYYMLVTMKSRFSADALVTKIGAEKWDHDFDETNGIMDIPLMYAEISHLH